MLKPLPPIDNDDDVEVGYGNPYSNISYIRNSYVNYGKTTYIFTKTLSKEINFILKKEIKKFNKDNIDDSVIKTIYKLYDSRNDYDFKLYLMLEQIKTKSEELKTAIDNYINDHFSI